MSVRKHAAESRLERGLSEFLSRQQEASAILIINSSVRLKSATMAGPARRNNLAHPVMIAETLDPSTLNCRVSESVEAAGSPNS